MRIPKRYGQSKTDNCPFCNKRALTVNSQGIPVCLKHKDKELTDLKCACGEWLDLQNGKFGPYFRCMKCGNISFRKAMEMNPQKADDDKTSSEKPKKDFVITSDDVDVYF